MEKTIPKKSFMSLVVAFLMLFSIVPADFDNAFNAVAATTGFHVSGTKILDGNNQEFVMRGVNIPHAWYKNYTQTSINAVASKGANVVRIVCADGVQWTKTTLNELNSIVNWCKNAKLVCILEVHDATGKDDAASLITAANYWVEMKSVLQGNEDYVILNIANEWFGSWNNASSWASGCKTAIQTIRNAGITNMIMIDAAGYGQWPSSIFQKGSEVFNADTLKNTVFSIHMYQDAGKNSTVVKSNIDNALAIGVPVVIGEFAADHQGSDVDEATIMSYCTQKNVGYLGWSWKGNSAGLTSLDMSNDWEGTSLTSWGDTLFNSTYGIKNTSKLCSIYTGAVDSSSNSSTGSSSSSSGNTGSGTVIAQGGSASLAWGTDYTLNFSLAGYDSAQIVVDGNLNYLKLAIMSPWTEFFEESVYGSYTYDFTEAQMSSFAGTQTLVVQGQGDVNSVKVIGYKNGTTESSSKVESSSIAESSSVAESSSLIDESSNIEMPIVTVGSAATFEVENATIASGSVQNSPDATLKNSASNGAYSYIGKNTLVYIPFRVAQTGNYKVTFVGATTAGSKSGTLAVSTSTSVDNAVAQKSTSISSTSWSELTVTDSVTLTEGTVYYLIAKSGSKNSEYGFSADCFKVTLNGSDSSSMPDESSAPDDSSQADGYIVFSGSFNLNNWNSELPLDLTDFTSVSKIIVTMADAGYVQLNYSNFSIVSSGDNEISNVSDFAGKTIPVKGSGTITKITVIGTKSGSIEDSSSLVDSSSAAESSSVAESSSIVESSSVIDSSSLIDSSSIADTSSIPDSSSVTDSSSTVVDDSSLPPVEGTPEYVSTNLTLTGIIGANAYYTVPDGYINSNYKVEAVFKASGVDETRVALNTSNTKVINGKKTYIFTLPVKSCDMAKRFSAKLVISTAASGKQVAATTTTAITLNNYIASLGNTGTAAEKDFAKAMQTYGYYSQKMFNPSSTLPSITPIDLSDVTYATVRNYSARTIAYDGVTKGTISGTSLYLDSGTGIRSYITNLTDVDTDNLYMQYTANGVTKRVKAQYSADKNAYYGEISDVAADKLSTMYDICFCEGTTQITDTSKYGAYSYIYSTLRTASSTDAQNLAKALYKYSVAAERIVPPTEDIDDQIADNSVEFAKSLQLGWNLGNTLDATETYDISSETSWGQPRVTKELIQYVKQSGFTSIRIPVSWSNHVDSNDNIDPQWMNRVNEIVDYAIDSGLYVIINAHHDCERYYPTQANYNNASLYIKKIWTQIAENFKDYDERLVFESMNEPRLKNTSKEWWFDSYDSEGIASIECIVKLNQDFVDTIRSSSGYNKTRFLMVPSNAASPDNALNNAFKMPSDTVSNRLLLSVHAYSPYDFAMNASGYSNWDSSKISDLSFMDQLYSKFTLNGYGVVIGEFGATNKNNDSARAAWAKDYTTKAASLGFACFVWDNGSTKVGSENFGLINRNNLTLYYPDILTQMLKGYSN